MAECEIHQGDIGTIFEITIKDCDDVPINISGATVKEIIWKKPDTAETVATFEASFGANNGTDGIIQYVTATADDLSDVGTYKQQAKVTLPAGVWSSNIEKFKVFENL